MTAIELRNEALRMLHGEGAILEVARHVTRVLGDAHVRSAVIGGVAVVLHGYVRTTVDVDVFIPGSLPEASDKLTSGGFEFRPREKEFLMSGVPVHLVTTDQAVPEPREFIVVDGVRTVSLPDLVNLKLHSGLSSITRAQDIGDVIGLIRARKLTSDFARRLDKSVRSEFRKLAKAVAKESS